MDLKNNFQNVSVNFSKDTGVSGYFGVYPAVVTDNIDPDGNGRILVRLPWLSKDTSFEVWARLATLMAGNNRGTWFVPDVDDEVLVAFESGDPRAPCVIGSLWNGHDTPPVYMDNMNSTRQICTRSGIKITLNDEDGMIKLETPGGRRLTLKDTGTITIEDDIGNKIEAGNAGISISTSSRLKLTGNSIEIVAGYLEVNTSTAKFSGIVQSDTLITNSVVSSSYTPGAGNIA